MALRKSHSSVTSQAARPPMMGSPRFNFPPENSIDFSSCRLRVKINSVPSGVRLTNIRLTTGIIRLGFSLIPSRILVMRARHTAACNVLNKCTAFITSAFSCSWFWAWPLNSLKVRQPGSRSRIWSRGWSNPPANRLLIITSGRCTKITHVRHGCCGCTCVVCDITPHGATDGWSGLGMVIFK